MSSRTTRSLALGLVSSALILALFFTCSGCDDDPNNPNSRNYATGHSGAFGRSYYRSRPFFFGWGGGSSFGGRPTVHTSSVGRTSSSGSSSHTSGSSATSRGGFGGTGSAHSSGS